MHLPQRTRFWHLEALKQHPRLTDASSPNFRTATRKVYTMNRISKKVVLSYTWRKIGPMLGQPWMKRRGIRVETVPGVEVPCYFGQLGVALPTISNLDSWRRSCAWIKWAFYINVNRIRGARMTIGTELDASSITAAVCRKSHDECSITGSRS